MRHQWEVFVSMKVTPAAIIRMCDSVAPQASSGGQQTILKSSLFQVHNEKSETPLGSTDQTHMSTAPVLQDQTASKPTIQSQPKPTKIRKKSLNGRPIPPASPSSSSSNTSSSQRRRFSLATVERSIAAKIYFEHYFDRLFSGKTTSGASVVSASRVRRRVQLEQELERLGVSDSEKMRIRKEFQLHERQKTRLSRERVNVSDFDVIKPLGRGAFGRVSLVKDRKNAVYYAMKMLKKEDMLKAHQDAHVRAERDMLTDAAADGKSQWIVKLMYSFQDLNHLYFVMEYLPGGDLLSLLITMDTFPEEMARFYAAEMILAIEETHRLGYVHRDIKPDNFLIDKQGHIRLADCGLATDFHWSHESQYYEVVRKHAYDNGIIPEEEGDEPCTHRSGACSCVRKTEKVEAEFSLASEAQELDAYIHSTDRQASLSESENDDLGDATPDPTDIYCHPPASHKLLTWRIRARLQHPHARTYSVVGTNNYIAPEILRRQPYDYSVDWWSLGVIIFEMLYGYPPFASKSRDGTRVKIMEWQKWLKFPPFVTRKTGSKFGYAGEVTPIAQGFIKELLSEPDDRLGGMKRLGPLTSVDLIATSVIPTQGRPMTLMSSMMTSMLLGRDAQMVKSHEWFRGFSWTDIRCQQAPWTPKLKSEVDTRYFDPGEEQPPVDEKSTNDNVSVTNSMMDLRKKLAFVGFTFKSGGNGRGHPKLSRK